MSESDHYQILGVPHTATQEQIKAAYRRMALRFHPDKNPDSDKAADRFKRCNDAFRILSDAELRAEYDRAFVGQGVQQLAKGFIDDVLGTSLGKKRAGQDVRYDLEISLREAAAGVTRKIQFEVPRTCASCGGSGAAPGGSQRCSDCDGRGDLREKGSIFSLPRPCPRCGGQGITVVQPCKRCGGVGRVEKTREFDVSLPPGVRSGNVKIIDAAGAPGSGGGKAGDLHIVVTVADHPLFEERGADLIIEVPVTFEEVALGGTVLVPTLERTVKMKVPAETQSGRIFRLRGKGLPRSGGGRGDQLVKVMVETPVAMDEAQRRRLQDFAVGCGPDRYPRRAAFAEQLRELEGGGDD